MESIKVYNLDQGGVQLVKPEHQMSVQELRSGRNAVFGRDDEGADLETRPGMLPFNEEAMDGSVLGFINAPLADLRPEPFTGEILPDTVASGPTDAGPSGAPTTTLVGAGTYAEALADPSDASYMNVSIPGGTEGGATSTTVFVMAPVPSTPAVQPDDDHFLTLRLYFDEVPTDCNVKVTFVGVSPTLEFTIDLSGATPAVFEEYIQPLSEANVEAALEDGWFDDPQLQLVVQSNSNDAALARVSFLSYTVP